MKKRLTRLLIVLMLAVTLIASLAMPLCAASKNIDGGAMLDVKQFEGKKIGVRTGTIHDKIAIDFIKDVQLEYYSSNADMIAALQSGKIDGALNDEPVIKYMSSLTEGSACGRLETGKDYIAMLCAKSDKGAKLVAEMNEYFAKLESNGEIERLQKKWFEGEEEDRVMEDYSNMEGEDLIIATDPGFPPLEYVKDNKIIGYDIELMILFCKEYGYKPVLENVEFGGILAGITSGKFDVGASGFSITEERKEEALFTTPVYISYGSVMYMDEEVGGGLSLSGVGKSFNKTFVKESRWKQFAVGIKRTLEITVLSIIFGTLLGFVMHLICRKGGKFTNAFSRFARWLIKGMPEVVMLMILFYIVFGRSSISGTIVAIIGFTLTFACSMHGMLQSGERSLDIGQYRAATALGYSDRKAFFRIILPQAARLFLPDYLANVSAHIKATAVVGYIAVVDITKVGDIVRGSTYEAFFPLIAVAAVYFILAALLCWIIRLLTRRLDPTKRSKEQILKGVELK